MVRSLYIPLTVQKETSAKLGRYLKNLFVDDGCMMAVQRVIQGTLKRSVTAPNSQFLKKTFMTCHKSDVSSVKAKTYYQTNTVVKTLS